MPNVEQKNTNKNYQEKDLLNTMPRGGGQEKKTEKKVFIFLAIFVLLSLSFGVWWLGRQIKSPFESSGTETNTSSQLSGATNTEVPKIENLRSQDTDQDGLNDYDELYFYRTSPYISDSDSDKLSDKMEIDQGSDPNCPEDTICGRELTDTNSNSNTNTEGSLPVDVTNLSASELRQIMRDAGASEELLSQIQDEDLLEIYQDILKTEGSELGLENVNDSQLGNGEFGSESIDYLDYETLINLKPPEIRQLLIEGGVPEDTLSQIDDDTLQQIYDESLTQNLEGITP